MKKIYFLLLMALSSSCIPYSKNPVSALKDAAHDPHLTGTWINDDPKEKTDGVLCISPKKDSPQLEFKIIDDKKREVLTGHASRVQKNTYLNIVDQDQDGKKHAGYIIAKYQIIKDNTLKLFLMENGFVKKMIQDKKVKGQVVNGKFIDDVQITANSKELQKFLENYDQQLFTEGSILKRSNKKCRW